VDESFSGVIASRFNSLKNGIFFKSVSVIFTLEQKKYLINYKSSWCSGWHIKKMVALNTTTHISLFYIFDCKSAACTMYIVRHWITI